MLNLSIGRKNGSIVTENFVLNEVIGIKSLTNNSKNEYFVFNENVIFYIINEFIQYFKYIYRNRT